MKSFHHHGMLADPVGGGIVIAYNSTMEHSATVIICKKNPNESENCVRHRTEL